MEMTNEYLEQQNIKELQHLYETANVKIERLQKEMDETLDFRERLESYITARAKEMAYNKKFEYAKENEKFAIDFLGGKKYIFTFGGFRFMPIKGCLNKKQQDIIIANMRSGYGITNFEDMYNRCKESMEYCYAKYVPEYEHEDFYKASTLKRVDLFYCLDNAMVFIPTSHWLMLVDNHALEEAGLYEKLKPLLGVNTSLRSNFDFRKR